MEPEDLALAHPGPRGQRDQVQPLRVPPLAGAEEGRKLGLGERCDRGARFLFRPPPVEPREARRRVERNDAILNSVVHDLSEEGDDLQGRRPLHSSLGLLGEQSPGVLARDVGELYGAEWGEEMPPAEEPVSSRVRGLQFGATCVSSHRSA